MATDLGQIRFTYEAETSSIGEATKKIDALDGASKDAAKSSDALGKAIKKSETSFKSVGTTYGTAAANASKFNQQAEAGQKSTMNLGHAAGQLGFQLQDATVQLQGGTAAMTVLAQQGSQVASVFGPGGAVLGAIIAVGAAMTGFILGTAEATTTTDELIEKIKELREEYTELTAAQNAVLASAKLDELDSANQTLDAAKKNLAELTDAYEKTFASLQNLPSQSEQVQGRRFEWISDLARELEEAEARVDTAADEVGRLSQEYDQLIGKGEGVSRTTRDQRDALQEFIESIRVQSELLGLSAREQAQLTAEKLGSTDADRQQISAIYDTIEAYEAEKKALDDRKSSVQEYMDQIGRNNDIVAENAARMEEDRLRQEERDAEARGRQLEALTNQLLSERELVENWYREKSDLINGATDEELDLLGGKQAAIEALEKEHQDRLRVIASSSQKSRLEVTQEYLGDLASLMDSSNREMFEIGKIAALSNAAIDAYGAVTGAYKAGARIGGPILGAAFASAAGLAQANNIMSIANTQYGSGGASSTASSATSSAEADTSAAASAQQAPQPQNVSIQLDLGDAELIPRGYVESLVQSLNEYTSEGGVLLRA